MVRAARNLPFKSSANGRSALIGAPQSKSTQHRGFSDAETGANTKDDPVDRLGPI
jgi:hypothetical protein